MINKIIDLIIIATGSWWICLYIKGDGLWLLGFGITWIIVGLANYIADLLKEEK